MEEPLSDLDYFSISLIIIFNLYIILFQSQACFSMNSSLDIDKGQEAISANSYISPVTVLFLFSFLFSSSVSELAMEALAFSETKRGTEFLTQCSVMSYW